MSLDLTADALLAIGSNNLSGRLAALTIDDVGVPDWTPVPSLSLEADDLRIERDYARISVSPYGTTNVQPTTTPSGYGRATIDILESRAEYDLFIAAMDLANPPTLEKPESACVQVERASKNEMRRVAYAHPDRSDVVVDTTAALTLEQCTGSDNVILRGDVLVALWEIDAVLTPEHGEPEELWSGRRPVEDNPMLNGTRTTAGKAQEIYVYARNATLVLPGIPGAHQIFVEEAALHNTGSVAFRDASGAVHGIEVKRQEVEIDGAVVLHIDHDAGGLSVRGGGSADQVSVDGTVLFGVAPASPGNPDATWPWLALLVLPALAVALWYVRPLHAERQNAKWGALKPSFFPETRRERRAVGYWILAARANKAERHRRSLRYAKRSLRLLPQLPDARFLRAVAKSHLGDHEAACEDFSEAYADLPDGRAKARAACAAAATCIRAGELEEAKAWLLMGIQHDVLYVVKRVQKRVFNALDDEDWFRSLRDGGLDAPAAEDAAFA